MVETVQYMLQYFHLDGFVSKETATSLLYCAYYYAIADGAG